MTLRDHLISMLDAEIDASRRVLAALPEDKFDWRPHEKSFTLKQLATHVANLVSWGSSILATDGIDFESEEFKSMTPPNPGSRAEMLELLESNGASARGLLEKQTDESLAESWTMRSGDHVIASDPRAYAFDRWTCDHGAHHRGQLTVYLRLLDVPVPGTFGPSADETM
jgi:uncharacterized damage-inducible protein DinB